MARNLVCSICANEARRRAVDDALLAGKGVRQIQAELGIPKSTVHNHKTRCVRPLVSKAASEAGRSGNDLLKKLDSLLKEALDVAKRAKENGNDTLLLKALNEARDTVRLMGDFTGAKPEPAGANLIPDRFRSRPTGRQTSRSDRRPCSRVERCQWKLIVSRSQFPGSISRNTRAFDVRTSSKRSRAHTLRWPSP